MRWFEDRPYTSEFLAGLDRGNFPLTYDMCYKNDSAWSDGQAIVRTFVDQEVSHPTAYAVFTETGPRETHIYSLEVHGNSRLKDYGRKLLEKFKERNDTITLSSLPESRIFYEKQGFTGQEGNRMIWKRPTGSPTSTEENE